MDIKRNQIALMNIQYKYFPLDKFLDDAVRYNVQNVELWGGAPHFHLEDMIYAEIKKIRKSLESRKLELVCFTPEQCVYPINIAAETLSERRRSIKLFEDYIRIACELGTDKVLVTSGWGYADNSNYQDAWKYSEAALYYLADLAQLHGVKIALEILRKDESNLVNDLPSLLHMITSLNHENLFAILDTIPMALAGESPKDYLQKLGDKLIHIHFIDGNPRGHLAWGDGVLDLRQYLKELADYNYCNSLSLEITDSSYYMNPEKSIAQSLSKLFEVIK